MPRIAKPLPARRLRRIADAHLPGILRRQQQMAERQIKRRLRKIRHGRGEPLKRPEAADIGYRRGQRDSAPGAAQGGGHSSRLLLGEHARKSSIARATTASGPSATKPRRPRDRATRGPTNTGCCRRSRPATRYRWGVRQGGGGRAGIAEAFNQPGGGSGVGRRGPGRAIPVQSAASSAASWAASARNDSNSRALVCPPCAPSACGLRPHGQSPFAALRAGTTRVPRVRLVVATMISRPGAKSVSSPAHTSEMIGAAQAAASNSRTLGL